MATRKLHPADVWTRDRIARTVSFTAVFVRSPLNGGNIVRRADRRARPLGSPGLRLRHRRRGADALR
jgi:hypothetical protein